MEKNINSELIIKSKVWKKDTFELIDYLSDETIKTKIKINSSGVLSKNDKIISFTQGEDIPKSPFNLLTIKKIYSTGKFIINCGDWSKDLYKLIEQQGAFLVYRGLTIKELNKNVTYRYYKLSQGDIFKIGRIYFKVLDIHLNKDFSELKSNNIDSTVRGSIMKSSSCNSIIINGQEIIKGNFQANQEKKQNYKLYFSKNENLNLDNNSLLTKKDYSIKNESLGFIMGREQQSLMKINSCNELFSVRKKESKIKNKKNAKNELILKKPKKNKNKPICRICYGEDVTNENPLICPCKCKGSMKYIHYECLKNWLNSKIEEDLLVDNNDSEIDSITYNRKDISCELCKEKLPDYIKYNDQYYNICFYKPKFEEFIVLESMKFESEKTKYIHLISFDNKYTVNIGRANECELTISELSVSRFHCMIHKEDGELFLEDNSSKFGTLVLIQNNNLVMNNYVPLRVQINKTFIKLKVKLPLFFSCCGNTQTYETKKYDYQVQNKKCFDILSYFIFKDNDLNQDDDDEEEENCENNIENNNNFNIKDLIENENKEKEGNNQIKNDIKIENEKNENNLNKSEIYNYGMIIPHSNRLKRINIKKGNNDNYELPKLDIIKIDNIRDNLSIISDKNKKSSQLLYLNNQQHQQKNKKSNIIIKKNNLNNDKTGSVSNLNNLNNNNTPNSPFSMVIKDYIHKTKKQK